MLLANQPSDYAIIAHHPKGTTMKLILPFASIITIIIIGLNIVHAAQESKFSVYVPLITNGSDSQLGNPTPQPTSTQPPVDLAQLKADAIAAVNNERAKAGCAPVNGQADLDNGAQAWADYLVTHNIYAHSDTVDINWYLNHGYTRSDWLYENVAAGPRTGAGVVALWMSDEGHEAAILAGCSNTSHTFDIAIGLNNYRWVLAIGELHD
jgi:uncharacterized protein YkwD